MIAIRKYALSLFVLLGISIGLIFVSSQLILGQSNITNSENKIKVPSHLDIESQSTQQEMSAIKNEPPISMNITQQVSNKTNSTDKSNQSQVSTNGTINATEIIANQASN